MNTTQQTEALPALIERFRGLHFDHAPDGWPAVRTREITALLDRITELESQLAQRFDAADMATAAAQGFRDGAAEVAKLKGQRMVLCSLLGECLPVIDVLMQLPGDDDSDAHLNGLMARVGDALVAIAEDQVKGGES